MKLEHFFVIQDILSRGGEFVTKYGTAEYCILDKDNFYHSEDGPAALHQNGSIAWWRHGIRHREDGPAIILDNGTETWYLEGRLVAKPPQVDPVASGASTAKQES